MIARFLARYRFKRQLDQRLAARKLLRPLRREAALRGWETRKAQP